MSARNVDLIAASIRARIPGIQSEDDMLAILRDLVTGLARNSADHAFWKVKTEGWTFQQAAHLSDTLVGENTVAIADTIHDFGGTLEIAINLAEMWVAAYDGRLKELHAAPSRGGRA